MKLAAAQTRPNDGNIEANINDHCRLAGLAADNGVQLIVFPEMSLTGYQRESAHKHAFTEGDLRLDKLKEVAANEFLHIGTFILFPDGSVSIYTKHFLHQGEEDFFTPRFDLDPKIKFGDETISFAICADITNPVHAANAAASGSTLYIPGIFYTPNGISTGHDTLAAYAKQHSLNVLMSNYGGPSWGLDAGGKSAFWNNKGELIAVMSDKGEGLLIAEKQHGNWHCHIIDITS